MLARTIMSSTDGHTSWWIRRYSSRCSGLSRTTDAYRCMPASLELGRAVRLEERLDVLGVARVAEQEALTERAAGGPYDVDVTLGLQPGRDDLDAEPAGEADHDVDDRGGRTGLPGRLAEQHPVDLEYVDRQPAQVGQRGRAGPEVVDGRADADGAQPGQPVDGERVVRKS